MTPPCPGCGSETPDTFTKNFGDDDTIMREAPDLQQVLPEGAAARKDVPLQTGLFDYFPDALCAVAELSRIGNDLEMDWGVGTCGKDGQGVPVGVGQPTLRIDQITVGGTEG